MLTEKELEIRSRAVLDLHGFFIITGEDGNETIIDNPVIIFKSLRPSELYVMDYYDHLSSLEKFDLENIIVEENVLSIHGYEDQKINLQYSPSGVVSSIAQSILKLSFDYLVNSGGIKYKNSLDSVTYLNSMQAIVSYYLNIPHSEVVNMSMEVLFKHHAICAATFPNQVVPLCEIKREGDL